MNRKTIVALFIWVCIGFNSPTAVQSFLDSLASAPAASSQIVAMPQAPGVPAFEVFVPLSCSNPYAHCEGNSGMPAANVPDGLACPE
jgi:hypothetical protein